VILHGYARGRGKPNKVRHTLREADEGIDVDVFDNKGVSIECSIVR
jgi:hypothetical protein